MDTPKQAGQAALPANTARPVATMGGNSNGAAIQVFSPDRALLAVAGREGDGRIWEIGGSTPRERCRIGEGLSKIGSIAFTPNGRYVLAASGALDGRIKIVDISDKQPKEIATLRGARGAISAVAVSPDGKLVVGGGEDRTLRIWDLVPAVRDDPRASLTGHAGTIRAVAFSPDNQSLASGAGDNTVRLWTIGRIRSWQRALLQHPAEVTHLTWSADGRMLATASADGGVRIWETQTGKDKPRMELVVPASKIRILMFTTAGTLLTVNEMVKVMHWDLASGLPLRDWDIPNERLSALAITGDGRYLAVGKNNGVVDIYRVADKR